VIILSISDEILACNLNVWLEGVENDQTDERKHQNDSGGENKKAFV
jgi:hypothetical protein